MRLLRLALLSTVFLATALVAAAQSVRWENGDSPLGNVVQLIFENCEPDGDPQLPKIENATLAFAGSATSVNMVNFNVTRTQVLSYLVQGRRGPLQIPEFTVKTNKGPIKVAAFNGAAPAISADSVATARLIPERTTVWAGEIFALNYKLTAARRNNPQFDSFVFDWNPAPLLTEEWSKPAATETVVDGQRQIVIDVSTRAYAKAAGAFKLEAAQQIVHVQTGAVGFGLFSQPRMEPVSVTSDQPTIEVRPLPAPPGQFSGAVGQFKLSSKVVPREAAVGEPVTWTLELSGTGNWPDIAGLPARDVSRDFQVVQPKAKRVNADGKLFDATLTEDVVLVPTKAGRYALGPVSFTYFNPKTGNYETVSTERVTVTINPAATAAPAPAAPEPAVGDTEPAAQTERRPQPKAPEAPAAIPRDPLRGSDTAAGPLTWRTTLLWVALPFALLVGYWLALAWRRALRTDPLRPQREAHQRLTALLTSMQSADPTRVGADTLLQWQRDVATLWQVNHAAPTAAQIEAAAQRARSAQAAAWARLWQDSEAGLYQARPSLPPDWVARAEAALEASPPRRFNPARLFLPRNLLAFAAVLAGVTILSPQRADAAAATSPEVAYNAGEFAQAETAWRQALTQNPRDWIARHNLALALAQQDRPGEAAAHAVVAFVQQPSDPSVRWHFRLTAEKAGYVVAPLEAFLQDKPGIALATWRSPAEWQRILIGAACLVAGALGWLLTNAYGVRDRWQTLGAVVLACAGLLAAGVATFGVLAYRETADARAAITWQPGLLRSIPTEADTTQKTTALPPGSIGRIVKPFLGWYQLSFANGQTGWVRKEEVVPLWEGTAKH